MLKQGLGRRGCVVKTGLIQYQGSKDLNIFHRYQSQSFGESAMRTVTKSAGAFLMIVIAGFSVADTIELADGTIIEGDFVGSSNGIVMFNTGDSIEAYPESQVVGIFLSEGVATAQALPPEPSLVAVPTGTRLVIRMVDSVDSSRHKVGHKFRGQLEAALVVDGVTAVPRGAFLYGTITSAKQAGRMGGKSEMTMEFTEIMIDDQLYPIATQSLSAQTGGEGKKTVGRTARMAAVGGVAGGSSGARTGAKVGVGVSLLTKGESLNVPAGTLLESTLRVPLNIS
jgi:hypothetical protein